MNFRSNIQHLRRSRGLTQEQLAEMLDVSRQAVSKWEAGSAYPEMDKLLAVCEIFSVDLNTLVHGDVVRSGGELHSQASGEHDAAYNRFSKKMAVSVAGIILSVAAYLFLTPFLGETPALLILLCLIAASLFIMIPAAMEFEEFKKSNPVIPENLYSEREVAAFKRKFPYAVATGILLLFLGVVMVIALCETTPYTLYVPMLLAAAAAAVATFIYYGIQSEKYDIKAYNEAPQQSERERQRSKKAEKLSGVIMMFATIVFFILGFIFNMWHIGWVAFPIGGVLCGIVNTLFND